MAYVDVSNMASNPQLHGRLTACAAIEGELTPVQWVSANIWQLVSAPGWGDAYAYAINTGKTAEQAGTDPGVITDGQILSQVQAVRG